MKSIDLIFLNQIVAGQDIPIAFSIAPGTSLEICPGVTFQWSDERSYQISGLGASGQFCVKGQIDTQKYPMQMNFALPNNETIAFKIAHSDSRVSVQGYYTTSDSNESDL